MVINYKRTIIIITIQGNYKMKYAIRVNTQNKSKSFIFFENDNLDYNKIRKHYSQMINKYNHAKNNGVNPTIKDNRNNYLLIRNIEIINTNDLFNNKQHKETIK